MKFLKSLRGAFNTDATRFAIVGLFAAMFYTSPALADPFANAAGGAQQFASSLKTFALAVGGIGMVACLMMGFFGKLNWKWVATGVGVSFSLAIVPSAITWLDSLGAA